MLAFPAPTAALVEGRCLGGGFELALCCDDIMAAADATFGLPEIKLAAFPPAAAALLPLRVGASRATRAIITGQTQEAEYWHDAGLVSMVAPQRSLLEAARPGSTRTWRRTRRSPCAHAAGGAGGLRAQAEPLLSSWSGIISRNCSRPQMPSRACRRGWKSARHGGRTIDWEGR